MASLALHLNPHRRKTLLKISPNFTLSHHFSSSSDNNGENASKAPNFSSFFNDVKSRLKEREQKTQQQQNKPEQSMGPRPFQYAPQSPSNPSKVASYDEIMKSLSVFRRRSSDPAPAPASPSLVDSQQPTLLQDLYKRNLAMSSPNPNANPNPNPTLHFDAIRESLRQLRETTAEKGKTGSDHLSLNKYRDSFKLGPSMAESGRKVYGGSSKGYPSSVFGREMSEREKKKKGEEGKDSAEDEMAKSELFRMYSHAELGQMLRDLRPESTKREKGRNEGWFSLTELNERLKKLREIEEKKPVAGSLSIGDLRRTFRHIQLSDDAKNKHQEFGRYDILGQLGGTPSFMLSPPKEHLVEKYFHPDNMSSEEKLKLELKRMRDEFKMHESDCGSTRVQIAQLTTEISHLSSLLHKKDKHSRRGLIAKVQQRKKLLKYLRRTDWDSYIFVLSKLGLRDNPDYKN